MPQSHTESHRVTRSFDSTKNFRLHPSVKLRAYSVKLCGTTPSSLKLFGSTNRLSRYTLVPRALDRLLSSVKLCAYSVNLCVTTYSSKKLNGTTQHTTTNFQIL